jgi:hypothetical protein
VSSRTTREQARARLDAIYAALRDRLIPSDESVPLGPDKFINWEDQADQIERELCGAFLEERAALAQAARMGDLCQCPYCASPRVYLIKRDDPAGQVELLTPHGPIVLHKQHCRCRSCGRSFSPSDTRVGPAGGGSSLATGGQPPGA